MGQRLNWDKANRRHRVREEARNPLVYNRTLLLAIWKRSKTIEEAAQALGIEPKIAYIVQASYGLPFFRTKKQKLSRMRKFLAQRRRRKAKLGVNHGFPGQNRAAAQPTAQAGQEGDGSPTPLSDAPSLRKANRLNPD